MKHDLPSWSRRALASAIVVALGAGVTVAAVLVGATDGDPPRRTVGAQGISLVAYDTCAAALNEMKARVLPHVGPYGFDTGNYAVDGDVAVQAEGDSADGGARAAAPGEPAPQKDQPQDHSTTNSYEAPADEPDLVKTDGKRVVSVADGVLRVVDVASRKQTAAVPFANGHASQLLLSGDRALVMVGDGMPMIANSGIAPGEPVPGKPMPPGTPPDTPTDTPTSIVGSQLVLVDLTGAGTVLGTLIVDGSYLDARQIGSVARVVVRSAPRFGFAYPQYRENPAAMVLRNKAVVENSTIADWLPRYELTTGGATTSGQLTDCAAVTHPTDYTATAMLTVLTVDLTGKLGTGDPVTIVADGDTVYATGINLYVADDHVAHTMMDAPAVEAGRTEVYQFDISGAGKPAYVASGAVDGGLLNQYSLSDHQGHLRVATTVQNQAASESMITVLARKGDELTQVGKVAGLGAGERIYAVRFMGDTGYVVTFRQTDPLYTVDLSDPAAPKVTGELKITGYSAYLHPAGDGKLIGVGQEATTDGRGTGAQVSLFDTANPAGARRVAQYHLENSWSDVEGDPHAFLYWPDKKLLVLPVSGGGVVDENGVAQQQAGALVLRIEGNSFQQVGMLSHPTDRYGNVPMAPNRAMVIGTELWTVSPAGMLVNDLDSLAQLAWLPFT
jgi:hypothetical protein